MLAHLEKAVQEGYIIGPFFERSVEERERSIDTRCVFAVVFVFQWSLLCTPWQSVTAPRIKDPPPYLPLPSWFLHCRGAGEFRPELSGETELLPGSRAMIAPNQGVVL